MTALSKQDSIKNLDLPNRILNPLKRSGLRTVEDLVQKDVEFFLKTKGFGMKSLFFLNKKLQEKFGKTITGSKQYNKKVEQQYLENNVHIFKLNFEKIFYEYKKKKKTSYLDELENFLTKSDCFNELYSGKISFLSFESADIARKFNNSKKARLFKKSLENFAYHDLRLQKVSCAPEKYWKRFKTELTQILNSILKPIEKKGCFGKFNSYAVFLLISSYNNVFDNNKLASRLLFFKNLNQFFRYEDKILNRPQNSPFRIREVNGDIVPVNLANECIDKTKLTSQGVVKKIKTDKAHIIEIINEILNSEINRIIFSNSNNSSFFQFAIVDKTNFLLDFPDYPSNGSFKKAELVRQLLLDYSFKLVAYSLSLKEKEFAQKLSGDNVLIQANCGSDRYLLSELIEVFSRKILGLIGQNLLEVEYID